MKTVAIVCAVVCIILTSYGAWAQCPVAGIYTTTNQTILSGRASEAWCGDVGPGRSGNTENAASWNSSALGTQWKVWGMYIDETGAVETGRSMDGSGNGWIDYQTNYLGGTFWLSKDHSWSDGVHDLTGTISNYTVATKVTYVGGQPVGATSNIYFTGIFDGCPNHTLEYVITNAMLVWRSDSGAAKPGNYPDMLCGANSGELFEVCCITASIHEVVAVEESSWGAIKEHYE